MPFVGNVSKIALCVIALAAAACSSGNGSPDETMTSDPTNDKTLASAPLPGTDESTEAPAPTA